MASLLPLHINPPKPRGTWLPWLSKIFEKPSNNEFDLKDDPEHPSNLAEPRRSLKDGRGYRNFAAWSLQDPALMIYRDFKEARALQMLYCQTKVAEAVREVNDLMDERRRNCEYNETAFQTGDEREDEKMDATMHKLAQTREIYEQELLRAEQLNRLRSPSAVELLSLQNKLHYSKDICEDELGVFLCQSELVVLSAEGHETWLEVIIKMAIRKLPFLQPWFTPTDAENVACVDGHTRLYSYARIASLIRVLRILFIVLATSIPMLALVLGSDGWWYKAMVFICLMAFTVILEGCFGIKKPDTLIQYAALLLAVLAFSNSASINQQH